MMGKKYLGLTGINEDIRLPDIQEEQRMKGIEVLKNEITIRDEEIADWKKEYKKLQIVCNVLVDKLSMYMPVDRVKTLIREQGLGVN